MITIILPSHTLQVSFEHLIAVHERLEDKPLMQLHYLCICPLSVSLSSFAAVFAVTT